MLSVDAYLKLLATLVAAAFGLLVLAGNPRRAANQALAVFLLLIAGNLGAEGARAIVAGTPADPVWHRVATVFAALDPVALYYFASVHPERNRLGRTWALAPVLAVGALLAILAGWAVTVPPRFPQTGFPPGYTGYQLALRTYTAIVYLVVLRHALLRHVGRETGRSDAGLLAALAIVAIPVWADIPVYLVNLTRALGLMSDDAWSAGWARGSDVGAALLAALVILLLARDARRPRRSAEGLGRTPPSETRSRARAAGPDPALPATFRGTSRLHVSSGKALPGTVRRAFAAAVLLTLVLRFGDLVFNAVALVPDSYEAQVVDVVGRSGAAVRWLLVSAIVSMIVIRDGAFGLSAVARRRVARVVVGLLFLGAVGILLTLAPVLAGDPTTMPLWLLAPLAAAVALSQGFQRAVDRVAGRLYALPLGPAAPRIDAYKAALREAVAAGRDPGGDAALARLRDELGIEPALAEALATSAGGEEDPLRPGRTVARRYRVEETLGRGGSGRVFLARDLLLDRAVALKEVHLDEGESEEVALREARLAGGVGHPNVVVVHDAILRPGSLVLVCEHVPGGSLAQRVRDHGKLAAEPGLRLVGGLLAGLAAVHARGVVHRDLKPANVLLAAEGTPKIADFGLARLMAGTTTRAPGAWGISGTPAFMAPEQRQGRLATRRTDVYAVGLIARACVGPLPPSAEAVIERALREEPEARWADAAEMLAAWEAALSRQAQ